jgi:hypothetical protein
VVDVTTSFAEVLHVLGMLGDVEWARVAINRTSSGAASPPLIVWRYKNPDGSHAAELGRAVGSYRGGVEWTLTKGRRNWVIWPTAVDIASRSSEFSTDSALLVSLSESDPVFCESALVDFENLLDHLKQTFARG